MALVVLIASLSFGALIFRGDLAFGMADGIRIALVSAAITGLVVSLMSSYPATMAVPQDRTAPILALVAAAVASALPSGISPQAMLINVLAAIALTSVLAGVMLFLVDVFAWGI